jgi:hypothetical protein
MTVGVDCLSLHRLGKAAPIQSMGVHHVPFAIIFTSKCPTSILGEVAPFN